MLRLAQTPVNAQFADPKRCLPHNQGDAAALHVLGNPCHFVRRDTPSDTMTIPKQQHEDHHACCICSSMQELLAAERTTQNAGRATKTALWHFYPPTRSVHGSGGATRMQSGAALQVCGAPQEGGALPGTNNTRWHIDSGLAQYTTPAKLSRLPHRRLQPSRPPQHAARQQHSLSLCSPNIRPLIHLLLLAPCTAGARDIPQLLNRSDRATDCDISQLLDCSDRTGGQPLQWHWGSRHHQ